MNPQSEILRLFESMPEDERRSLVEKLNHLSPSKKVSIEGGHKILSGIIKEDKSFEGITKIPNI